MAPAQLKEQGGGPGWLAGEVGAADRGGRLAMAEALDGECKFLK